MKVPYVFFLVLGFVASTAVAFPFERSADFSPVSVGTRHKVSGRTRLYAEFQIKYGLYHNYLGRRIDRPLYWDRSLRPADNAFAYETPASYLINVREARRMGLDGFNLITLRDRFDEFVALDRWAVEAGVGDFANLLTVGYGERSQKQASAELFGKTIDVAIKNPCSPKINGRPLIATYNYGMYSSNEHRAFVAELEKRSGKDGFVLCGDISADLLARLRRSYDQNGRLSTTEQQSIEDGIREVLDVAGGIQLSVPQYYRSPEGPYPRQSDFRLFDEYLRPALEKVFSMPQYHDKALGFFVHQGYVNYKNGDHDDEAGTATLRNELRRVAGLNPDYLLFFEWNEADENTMFQPTVSGGSTVGRIVRYYSRILNGFTPDLYPGDDSSVPPLVLSSRSTVKLGEELHFEILNIPDGSYAHKMNAQLGIAGLDGRAIVAFPEDSIDPDSFGAIDYRISTRGLKGGDVLIPTLRVNGKTYAGFAPVRVEPTVSWNYKVIRQSLRDLPQPRDVQAIVRRREGEKCAFGIRGDFSEPLASVELLADGKEVSACGIESEYDFTSNIIVRLAFTVPGNGAGARLLKVRVNGAYGCRFTPEYAPNVDSGRLSLAKEGEGYDVSVWFWTEEVVHFVQMPRKCAKAAVIEIGVDPGSNAPIRIPAESVIAKGTYSAMLDERGLRVDAQRVLTLPDLPPHLCRSTIDWHGCIERGKPHALYHFRAITESGHVWRSEPFRPDAPRLPEVEIDVFDEFAHRPAKAMSPVDLVPKIDYVFNPAMGLTIGNGNDSSYNGQLGGGYVFGETYFAEIYHGSGIRVERGSRSPAWIMDDGKWCLSFDGTNDYINLPIEALPHAAFTLDMEIKPEIATNAPMVLFRHYAWTCGSLSLFIYKEHLVATWADKDWGRSPTIETGLRVTSGEWHSVKVGWNFRKLTFCVDGRTMSFPWSGRAWGMRPSAFGGHDKNEMSPDNVHPAYYRGLLRKLSIWHMDAMTRDE